MKDSHLIKIGMTVPIHQGTRNKGSLRRWEAKQRQIQVDINREGISGLNMLRIDPRNNSFLAQQDQPILPKRSVSTCLNSNPRSMTAHSPQRNISRQAEQVQPSIENPPSELTNSVFVIQRMNRVFLNAILNKRNKSFRVKQRHEVPLHINPLTSRNPQLSEVRVSGRMTKSGQRPKPL